MTNPLCKFIVIFTRIRVVFIVAHILHYIYSRVYQLINIKHFILKFIVRYILSRTNVK